MLFGATPFANSPFADPGGVTVFVSLTGNRVNVSTGTVGISASARILPGGSEIEISVGNVVAKIGPNSGCNRGKNKPCNRYRFCDIMEPDSSRGNWYLGTY